MKKKDYGTGIPRHEIEALARCLLPEIQKFFESEDGQKEFEEWKRQQAEKQKTGKNTDKPNKATTRSRDYEVSAQRNALKARGIKPGENKNLKNQGT